MSSSEELLLIKTKTNTLALQEFRSEEFSTLLSFLDCFVRFYCEIMKLLQPSLKRWCELFLLFLGRTA